MVIKLPKRLHNAAETLRFPKNLYRSQWNKGQREVVERAKKAGQLYYSQLGHCLPDRHPNYAYVIAYCLHKDVEIRGMR